MPKKAKAKALEWFSGPPPHIGWWNASVIMAKDCWRWWDGCDWSRSYYAQKSPWPNHTLLKRREGRAPILWNNSWPDNARVPRLDPTDGHWTFNVEGKAPWSDYAPWYLDFAFSDGSISLQVPSNLVPDLLWAPEPHSSRPHVVAWRPRPRAVVKGFGDA